MENENGTHLASTLQQQKRSIENYKLTWQQSVKVYAACCTSARKSFYPELDSWPLPLPGDILGRTGWTRQGQKEGTEDRGYRAQDVQQTARSPL